MAGVTLAGLAEGMALADRAGLQQKDVLEVMELTSLACPTILDKGKGKFYLPLLVTFIEKSEDTIKYKLIPEREFFERVYYLN